MYGQPCYSPLVERYARRDNSRAHAGNNAADDDHAEGVWSAGAGLHRLAYACNRHARQSGIATTDSVGDGMCEEDVAHP